VGAAVDAPGVLAASELPTDLAPATAESLRRNGLHLARVDPAELPEIEAGLGVANIDLTAWLGQVYSWRSLTERAIAEDQEAVSLGGGLRRLEPGTLQLLARAWSVPMEDGPRLCLEIRVRLERRVRSRLYNLGPGRRAHGDMFSDLSLEVLLEPDFAYVLTSVPTGSRQSAPDGTQNTPGLPTVGDLLLRGPSQPAGQTVLVFLAVSTTTR
jgi:hypothetical protein